MTKLSDFTNSNPLIILDLANNHNGSLQHGKRIIDEIYEVVKDFEFKVAVKFQYRNLPDFIHRDFQERLDLKYVDRFLSTRLSWDEFLELKNYINSKGMLSACTPFDEYSIDKIVEHQFDILKIASASFTDWSLLESTTRWAGPIVASTAGANLQQIERVVSFLQNRNHNFAIMHCVAAYPTEDHDLALGRITSLREHFLNVPIGYSTHENPNNVLAGPLALASGAVILERHVGSEYNNNKLNNYSSGSHQLSAWLHSISQTIAMIGPPNRIETNNVSEQDSLAGLRRYAYTKKKISKGQKIGKEEIYFAIPGNDNQLTANEIGKYIEIHAGEDLDVDQPLIRPSHEIFDKQEIIYKYRNMVLEYLVSTGITIPQNLVLELSHHYGVDSFLDFGSAMLTVVNREYCKKLIILLPGQKHPAMLHKKKDETFLLLHGDMNLFLNNVEVKCGLGETVNIAPEVIHEFSSDFGAIIEEISTNHSAGDSFYLDEKISNNLNRKTFVEYWS